MSQHFFHQCSEPGCLERVREKFCPAHSGVNNTAARNRAARDHDRKTTDPVWKLYSCAAWVRFRASVLSCNPICARLVDGAQCHRPATVVHHIISPRKNSRAMYSYSNVRCVCAQHHPPSEGEPVENLDRLNEVYVSTNAPIFRF